MRYSLLVLLLGGLLAAGYIHGTGHGLLSWSGLDVEEALSHCDTLSREDRPYCYDGVFMENLWAVHEGGTSPDQWIDSDDLTYPCSDPRIKEKWQGGCWSNQPAVVYQQTDGDLDAAATVCANVDDAHLKDICFDGLARQIHPLTDGSAKKTISICRDVMPQEWQHECIISIVQADFSTGGRELPFEVCERVNGETKQECQRSVRSLIGVYHDGE